MASINGVRGGGANASIFGNRNVISGLASGMDTEGMIENAVSGYKMKISKLQQQRMKMEWQQTAYRSMIDKMVSFNKKYLSYASGNNLLSSGFFESAVNIVANGANASKVSAVGKITGTVQVNSITQLATSSTYSAATKDNQHLKDSTVADASFDVTSNVDTGKMSGGLVLGFGGKQVQINFNEGDAYKSAKDMVDGINKKLEDQTIAFDDGTQVKANERIQAELDKDGKTIRFKTINDSGNNGVWIEAASKSVEEGLGIDTSGDGKTLTSFTFDQAKVMDSTPMVDVLHKNGLQITYNGETQTIYGPSSEELGQKWSEADYISKLQEKVNAAFGANTLTVKDADSADGKVRLQFSTSENATFSVTSTVGNLIGMENGVGSSISPSRKLGDLMQGVNWDDWRIKADGSKVTDIKDGFGRDADGNRVKQDASGDWYRVDKDGNDLYAFDVNGKTIATFSKESTLQNVLDGINKSPDSPIQVSYSGFTGKFLVESKKTGANTGFEIKDGLAGALFGNTNGAGSNYKAGQDAKFRVTVNGEVRDVTQSSNSINIDGMKLTMKETFAEGGEPVTFTEKTDADKIVKVVKSMVEDYNAMAEEIKKAYSTMPMMDSNGKYYEPLTDDDRAEMSESAIKAYEEKAKAGILFADRDLSNLYDGLTRALGGLGKTGNDALNLGLTISYNDGATTLDFDEDAFRKALENDPEKVKNVFTASKANGDAADGLMQGLSNQIEKYAGTMGAVKGILISKAGSPHSPASIYQNAWQKKLDDVDKQVTALQKKMSNQIDFYNHKFTMLEQMVLQMNNQSSMLMGMTGGF